LRFIILSVAIRNLLAGANPTTGGMPTEGTSPRAEPCRGSKDEGAKTPANKATGGKSIEGTSPRAEPCWGSTDMGAKTPANKATVGRFFEGTSPQPGMPRAGVLPSSARHIHVSRPSYNTHDRRFKAPRQVLTW